MLTLTDEARTAVSTLTDQAGVAPLGGLRIAPAAGVEGSLELAMVPEPQEQDEVVVADDARVFLEPSAAEALANLTLDTDPTAPQGGTAFVLAPQR